MTHNLGMIDRNQYLAKDNAMKTRFVTILTPKKCPLSENVKQSDIYFDVGFGFGKQDETAKYLIDNIENITAKAKPKSLVGHSRKPSVLGTEKTAVLTLQS